jgi:acetylornithine deacetylase/succinyl-diaminopimelate desuccinylase-like protein
MRTAMNGLGLALALTAGAAQAQTTAPRPDQLKFRALYKELVETNTTLSVGSCTLAAQRMAAHLRTAGFKPSEITLFTDPAHPKEGGLVAVLPGRDPKAKAVLLLAHLDVVEAKRADWTRDPFKLVEENGYFYARGASDDKSFASIWTDAMARFRADHYQPKRTIKMALTCGEETTYAFNGADWLAKNKRALIDAEFALNEGGGGTSDGHGKVIVQEMQVGEKTVQNFKLETTNPGGHSSIPVSDNAIYQLQMTDTTRAYFAKAGAGRKDAVGAAMMAIAKDPTDKAAEAALNKDRTYHSMLRTTCVATLLEGGHANNALPQRAAANVNCRMFPGRTVADTQAALAAAINDPGVKITPVPPIRPLAVPPPLDPRVMGPAERLAAKYFPGVPVVPSMSTGATDGIFLEAVGIPTYGVPGPWGDPGGNGEHGLNESQEVNSLYVGRDYLTDLVKAYAED